MDSIVQRRGGYQLWSVRIHPVSATQNKGRDGGVYPKPIHARQNRRKDRKHRKVKKNMIQSLSRENKNIPAQEMDRKNINHTR